MMMKSTHDSPILVTGAAGSIGATGRAVDHCLNRDLLMDANCAVARS
jgi:hypothetical protein